MCIIYINQPMIFILHLIMGCNMPWTCLTYMLSFNAGETDRSVMCECETGETHRCERDTASLKTPWCNSEILLPWRDLQEMDNSEEETYGLRAGQSIASVCLSEHSFHNHNTTSCESVRVFERSRSSTNSQQAERRTGLQTPEEEYSAGHYNSRSCKTPQHTLIVSSRQWNSELCVCVRVRVRVCVE